MTKSINITLTDSTYSISANDAIMTAKAFARARTHSIIVACADETYLHFTPVDDDYCMTRIASTIEWPYSNVTVVTERASVQTCINQLHKHSQNITNIIIYQ